MPLPEYPRPQLVREDWRNLNGLWSYAVRAGDDPPAAFDGEILVPFAIESALSGVMRRVEPDEVLWYRRAFEVPDDWSDRRLLLHFGAVDWDATVWVDGTVVGRHQGGYDPFSFDVTDALADGPVHELLVRVSDPTDAGTQPRGKQVRDPHAIWYTSVTGIWQTVWLEPVPEAHVARLRIEPDLAGERLRLTVVSDADPAITTVHASVLAEGRPVATAAGRPGEPLALAIPVPRAWSPDDPFLYDLDVELRQDGVAVDRVTGYAGVRDVAIGADAGGVPRILLNGEPLFQYGLLDQGYWPDGLYTAPTDAALRYDLEVTKDLGFNLVRKHVKVEPARWYYWADRLGLLVWQDMPNGGPHVPYGEGEATGEVAWAANFERELVRVVDALHGHPSIVTWVVFNEGWGQHHTARLAALLEGRDPTRLVNAASGWNDLGTGSLLDIHWYTGPGAPDPDPPRASVLGEFGGLGLAVPGHTWQARDNWGYQSFADADALTDAYLELVDRLWPLSAEPGLAAAIYTQTTDVEIEVNGLLTYDRAVLKMDPERLRAAHERLLREPPVIVALVPTAERAAHPWRWTTDAPDGDWTALGYDDAGWHESAAGFGAGYVAGSVVRTPWRTPRLWLRTTFELDADPADVERLRLRVHHDDDVDVYLNGVHVVTLPFATRAYVDVDRDDALRAALRTGTNVLAARATQAWGGQYVDLGLLAHIASREVKP
ncbi:MAG: sugar-binding domain-containing protein [Trueperaceae bacterium]